MQLGDTRKLSQDTQEALRKRAIKKEKRVLQKSVEVGGLKINRGYRPFNTVKQRAHRRKMSRNQKELSGHLRSTLAQLQKEPETIQNLFRTPTVQYALKSLI